MLRNFVEEGLSPTWSVVDQGHDLVNRFLVHFPVLVKGHLTLLSIFLEIFDRFED